MPALLNSRSRRPKAVFVASKSADDRVGIAHVGRDDERPGAGRSRVCGGLVQGLAPAAGEHDRVSIVQEGQGGRPADPGPRARDMAIFPLSLIGSSVRIHFYSWRRASIGSIIAARRAG